MASLRGDQMIGGGPNPGRNPENPGERMGSRLAQRPHPDPADPIESLDCQQEMTTVRRDRKQVFGRRRQRLLKTLKRRGVRTRRWSHAEEADRTSRADDKAGKGRNPREPRRDTPRLACNRGAVPHHSLTSRRTVPARPRLQPPTVPALQHHHRSG